MGESGDVWVGDACVGEGCVVVWWCWGEGECVRRFVVCVGETGFGGMFGRVCGFLGGWLAGRSGGFVDGLVTCVFCAY